LDGREGPGSTEIGGRPEFTRLRKVKELNYGPSACTVGIQYLSFKNTFFIVFPA
jgi:hypothetical protein